MREKTFGCNHCGGSVSHVEAVEGITRLGTILGHELIKCENGCSKAQIIPTSTKVLPDDFFLEMITYARSIGKKISTQDKAREMNIFQRNRG